MRMRVLGCGGPPAARPFSRVVAASSSSPLFSSFFCCSTRTCSAHAGNGDASKSSNVKNLREQQKFDSSAALPMQEELMHAAEAELRHLQHDVSAFPSSTSAISSSSSFGSHHRAAQAVEAPHDALENQKNEEQEEEQDGPAWPEPTLEDLDRSIPQVDCEFIANLIRCRNLQREEFLKKKQEVQHRVEELTKAETPTVTEAVQLPRVGGFSLWRRLGMEDEEGGEHGLAAVSPESPVVASATVLEQLTSEERDLVHTTRPDYKDGFVILDCRTVNEVTSWGMIEGAKVLPAHELFDAFHATPDDFLRDYGFAKPHPNEVIICYCQYGPRSLMAAQMLSWMGYLKVLHFRDGYYEWGKQYNLLLRRWMEHDKESGNELRRLASFQAGLELQRSVAPEFNALPMKEAAQYIVDKTRSRGTMLIGEGLRAEAYAAVAKLTEGLAPTALPGVLDRAVLPEGGDGASSATMSTSPRLLGEQHLARFLEQTTGLDPHREVRGEKAAMDLGEAQGVVLKALRSGRDPGGRANLQAPGGQRRR